MDDNFDLVVVGSLHIDIMVKGPRLPDLDETVMGKALSFKCGGKGGHQVVASAKSGATTIFVGCVGSEISAVINLEAARALKHGGAYVVYNTAPYLPLSEELLRHVDLIVANCVEVTEATRIAIASLDDASRAAKIMSSHECSVIVTAGELGCALWTREGESKLIPAYKVKVISTHGAGDVFCGLLAAQIARGADLVSAAIEANMIAAQFVSGFV